MAGSSAAHFTDDAYLICSAQPSLAFLLRAAGRPRAILPHAAIRMRDSLTRADSSLITVNFFIINTEVQQLNKIHYSIII